MSAPRWGQTGQPPVPRRVAATGRTRTRMGEVPAFAEGLYEVAPDTFAWLVPNGSWGETNLGLVRGQGESALIDTCWDLHFMREMLAHSEPVWRRDPIRHVINTHADGDHCWGNQLLSDQHLVATRACVAQMHHHTPGQLRALQRASALARHLPHSALGGVGALGRYMGDMLRPYRFQGIVPTPARHVFEGQCSLDVGGVALHLQEVGPGHTDGDCWVHLPERDVVFAGDILFVGVTPVAWAGPVSNLVVALQRLLALGARVVVPGHGPLATPTDIQAQIDYWLWLQATLKPMAQAGQPVEVASRACLKASSFRRSPFAGWAAPERLFTSACTLYREWGLPVGRWPGALGTLDHFRRQALLCMTPAEGAAEHTRSGGSPPT
ncbi:MBL fold metallo-hydrolase [Aquabacterium lacunae]|uniref:MBL fold metallo-hydrolase n=1 Tax=Aquabacterium lacunae TaxID=2528630 RepID=A0A4Q9H0C1_9BURK|nr:MBL fold metallo-hydrolase [Aquabacterium lacunae]TBO32723.1 MBL fold metallo-hydrolase [Aquabacterium lacunae]